jgi:predicted nucleotidyltransferase
MTRSELLKASEEYIRGTLQKHLSGHPSVFLFGSRARQTERWNSDFDLWVDADIPDAVLVSVTEDIEESFVPFKVDIVTTPKLRGRFGEIVRAEAKPWM